MLRIKFNWDCYSIEIRNYYNIMDCDDSRDMFCNYGIGVVGIFEI